MLNEKKRKTPSVYLERNLGHAACIFGHFKDHKDPSKFQFITNKRESPT